MFDLQANMAIAFLTKFKIRVNFQGGVPKQNSFSILSKSLGL